MKAGSEEDEWLASQAQSISLKKKTNMEDVRQVKLDRRQAEAERGTVNLDRLLCFKVDEYGCIYK